MKKTNRQSGAVSLFVVIFAALLITVVTVSFVRIMIQNQQQATALDLSQSAYDSAQAGVEDAKRALIRYQNICSTGTPAECVAAQAQINSGECNTAVQALEDVAEAADDNEVRVQNGTDENALDQAYTCVKIDTQPEYYINSLDADESLVVPLAGTNSFDSIRIEWFNSENLQEDSGTTVNTPLNSGGMPLLTKSNWNTTTPNRPPVMRAQLIEFNTAAGVGFNLADFNGSASGNGSSNALFLYPSDIAQASSFSANARVDSTSSVSPPNSPYNVECSDNLSSGGYACSATLSLPTSVDANHDAYLVLKSFYKSTNFRVSLLSGGSLVNFDGVQSVVDSTGRANDLFRRVQARVMMIDDSFPYPQAEIDINGNLCKDFMITDDPADFTSNPNCTP